jgi:hypothetical protein
MGKLSIKRGNRWFTGDAAERMIRIERMLEVEGGIVKCEKKY